MIQKHVSGIIYKIVNPILISIITSFLSFFNTVTNIWHQSFFCNCFKTRYFLGKSNKPGYGNLVQITSSSILMIWELIFFKFSLIAVFLDYCAVMMLDTRINTYNLPQFFHVTIGNTGKTYWLNHWITCALVFCKWQPWSNKQCYLTLHLLLHKLKFPIKKVYIIFYCYKIFYPKLLHRENVFAVKNSNALKIIK